MPILLFAAFWAVLLYMVFMFMGLVWNPIHLFSLGFFTLITLVLHQWQEQAYENDPKGFVRRFMLGLMIKLFLSLTVVVAMLMLLKSDKVSVVLVFAFLYLAFLAFSTVRLVSLSKT